MSTRTETEAPAPAIDDAPAQKTPTRRISLAEYDAMTRDGRLGPDDRVELLDGVVVKKMNKGPRHVTITHRIFLELLQVLPDAWYPRKEDPVELPGGPKEGAPSMPEPDVSVVKGDFGTYAGRHPNPDDVALVIEVASETRMLARDRAGLARYAWNGIACVWIVNLEAGVIEVYTRPSGPGAEPVYEDHGVKGPGDRIEVPLGDDRLALDVSRLLA